MNLIEKVHKWGGAITSSIPSGTNSWFWNVLSRNVSPNFWRSAVNREKIASIHKIVNIDTHKITIQQIISTGFNSNLIDNSSLEPSTFGNQGNNKISK